MSRKIYIGNLNYATVEDSLRELFSPYGRVASVQLVTDRMNGSPRGFAFVEMDTDEQAAAAIQKLDGLDFEGRKLRVNSAQERESRSGQST
ncbi:MAG: RNA-binding protein [Spirochaetales bacterium]|nr:MAG: RNA-binding protein [Spirochaetales bacterium]